MSKCYAYNIALVYGIAMCSVAIFISISYMETALLNRLNEKIGLVDRYNRISKYLPLELGLRRLKLKRENLERSYRRSIGDYGRPLESERFSKAAPSILKEEIVRMEERLQAMAKETGMKLPASLGLDTYKKTLTDRDKAYISGKIYATARLVTMAMNANVLEIERIESDEPVLKEPIAKSDEIAYQELPIKLKIKSSSSSLTNFLYQLSRSKDIFVIKNINAAPLDPSEEKGTVSAPSKSMRIDLAISYINFVRLW